MGQVIAMTKCPFHGDTDPSLAIYENGFYCFGCHKSGKLEQWMTDLALKKPINKSSINTIKYMKNAEDYTYSSELDFEAESVTILAFETGPIPFEYSNSGTWELTNNETDLILTDDITGEQADYEIVSITENTAFMNGSIMVSQDVMGMDFTFELDVQMQLEKE